MFTIINQNKCSDKVEKEHPNKEMEPIDSLLDSMKKYRKIVQAGIARWVKDFQSGNIEIKTVDDLKKLIEIDNALQKDEIYLRKSKSRQQRR